MPKNVQPSAADSAPTHVAFETGNLKVEFAFVGVGVAVMVPSWQKEAIILEPYDLRRLQALISGALSKL